MHFSVVNKVVLWTEGVLLTGDIYWNVTVSCACVFIHNLIACVLNIAFRASDGHCGPRLGGQGWNLDFVLFTFDYELLLSLRFHESFSSWIPCLLLFENTSSAGELLFLEEKM